jgi:hypothetical protein
MALCHVPTVVDVAEAVVVAHADLGEEHLVEARAAGHLAERADLDAGCVHVESEVRETFVLRGVGVGSGDEHPAVGDMGEGVPYLLTGNDPFVTIAYCSTTKSSEVRTGSRLGEQLTPRVFSGEDPPKQGVALLVGPVRCDRGTRHGDSEKETSLNGLGPSLTKTPVDVFLERGSESEATTPDGEVNPSQAEVVLAPPEGDFVGCGRIQLGEQCRNSLVNNGGGVGGAHRRKVTQR